MTGHELDQQTVPTRRVAQISLLVGMLLLFGGLSLFPVQNSSSDRKGSGRIPTLPRGVQVTLSAVAILSGTCFVVGGLIIRKHQDRARSLLTGAVWLVAGYFVLLAIATAVTMYLGPGPPLARLAMAGVAIAVATVWNLFLGRVLRYLRSPDARGALESARGPA